MKIKQKRTSYHYAISRKTPTHKRPKKPSFLFRTIIRVAAIPDLIATRFRFTKSRMQEAGKGPYLILMNHSSFIDLEIVSKMFYPKPYCIICTSDGFVGKNWLMRQIGCIPTPKFVTDIGLVRDMLYTVNKLKTSILMYPEASYSFDGCATPLPRHLGALLKKMNVPVLTIMTDGAFLRDPLYNGLQKRKVKVSAHLHCLFTKQDLQEKSIEELDALLDNAFTFDNFAKQKQDGVTINAPFRADGLHRILYRCPHCDAEGKTEGKGTTLTCHACGKVYEMDIYGQLTATDGDTAFSHIPDWYNWERTCVREEIQNNTYALDTAVDIGILSDYKAIYMVGEGRLIHNANGFTLSGCDGDLHYTQSPKSCYGLYADYYWYEIGDVICIGNKERLYYCFPKKDAIVAKARLAAEEMYKLQHHAANT